MSIYEAELRRMSRSNTNKESIIKDLRSKIALLEKKELEVEDGDISTLSIQDLRRR